MTNWLLSDHLLTIVLPFRRAGRFTQVWAGEELEINFRRQPRAACRCTLAFAAVELQRFLERTVPGLSFGLPADGVRKRGFAQVTQFCASQPALVEFLGNAMLKRLCGDWSIADRIDMWGFDTWGQTCHCTDCRMLGNASDQMLHFASQIRVFLNRAEGAKKLDRHVTLILCAYEGTTSLQGPSRPGAGCPRRRWHVGHILSDQALLPACAQ